MVPRTEGITLAADRPAIIDQFRELLDCVGYREDLIAERLDVKDLDHASFGPKELPRLLWRTRASDPLSLLIRLFLLGVPVEVAPLRRSIHPMNPAALEELGLVARDGSSVRRLLACTPSRGLRIAHDFPQPGGRLRFDHVLGVTGTTRTLAELAVRSASRRTLDLGTGSGYLALLAATFSQSVLATDSNPRAVAVARFNARLNGMDRIEAACGDLYQPCGDLRFDLILCNPPFVISPDQSVQFRDSGLRGDVICEQIVRQAPAHLADGGFAQILCNWARGSGEDWRTRIGPWVDNSSCDCWILHCAAFEIDRYAEHWLREDPSLTEGAFSDSFQRWVAHYQELGIEAIDFGLIVMRRRNHGTPWSRFDLNREANLPNGTAILAGFAARDLLEKLGDDATLLRQRPRCRRELRWSQRLRPSENGWLVDESRCELGAGLGFEGILSQEDFHLLTLCRGRATLADIILQVAARTNQDPESIAPRALSRVREFIEQGFLWVDEIERD